MVTYEALSWGLLVITTYNSGSIVKNKIDGFIVRLEPKKQLPKALLISIKTNIFLKNKLIINST